jgi:hypothetical protein
MPGVREFLLVEWWYWMGKITGGSLEFCRELCKNRVRGARATLPRYRTLFSQHQFTERNCGHPVPHEDWTYREAEVPGYSECADSVVEELAPEPQASPG